MAIECPASGCDYTGTLDAVEGHVGGVADALHEGVVTSGLAQSLHGEGSGGVDGVNWKPLVAVGIVVLIGLWWLSRDTRTSEEQAAEGPELGGEW